MKKKNGRFAPLIFKGAIKIMSGASMARYFGTCQHWSSRSFQKESCTRMYFCLDERVKPEEENEMRWQLPSPITKKGCENAEWKSGGRARPHIQARACWEGWRDCFPSHFPACFVEQWCAPFRRSLVMVCGFWQIFWLDGSSENVKSGHVRKERGSRATTNQHHSTKEAFYQSQIIFGHSTPAKKMVVSGDNTRNTEIVVRLSDQLG